jgi:hypothetical protein
MLLQSVVLVVCGGLVEKYERQSGPLNASF